MNVKFHKKNVFNFMSVSFLQHLITIYIKHDFSPRGFKCRSYVISITKVNFSLGKTLHFKGYFTSPAAAQHKQRTQENVFFKENCIILLLFQLLLWVNVTTKHSVANQRLLDDFQISQFTNGGGGGLELALLMMLSRG